MLELWVDETHHFGGDYYAFRKAPLILSLAPGSHRVDVRLIRDVRLMGGIGEPKITIRLKAEITNPGLAVIASQLLVPDVVNGLLAGSFASVPVRNDGHDVIDIVGVTTPNVCSLAIQSCAFTDAVSSGQLP